MIHLLGIVSDKEISEIRPLEDVEYQEIVIARNKLNYFATKHELFRLVDANYMEYKTALTKCSKMYRENASRAKLFLDGMVFDLNRLVLNFLSAVRTFLDHAETKLKTTYGEESENFKVFKKSCSLCFDNCFSYRFLYKLRNYSQHVGMPITGLQTSSELVHVNPKEIEHKLGATVLKSDLLSDLKFNWGQYKKYDKFGNSKEIKIKDEISRLPDQIDINPYINELMHCIEKINATLCEKEEFIELLQHTAFLDKFVKEASIRDGTPCIFVQVQDISNTEKLNPVYSPQLRITLERFPLNIMEFVDLMNIHSKGNSWNINFH
jgi:hypothetical protein